MKLEISVEEMDVAPEVAVPLGLILNEFVTNSLRHAFKGKGGTIGVTLETAGDAIRPSVSDDGRGLPADRDDGEHGSGTGIQLIKGLAEQIEAEAVWLRPERGTALRLDCQPHGGQRGEPED